LKKDSVNDSNVTDGLCNVTEGVLPSLPPVESQDTAYEPKSKVTDRYATRHAPGRARNNVKEGGSILEVTMDDEDNYCSEEGHYCEKRIESYVNELIPPYTTLAIPPVHIKGFQQIVSREEDLKEEKRFLRREYSSERRRQDSERATFHSMLLSLERVEKLILGMISRVDWNECMT
jgi:hypothetical protein